MKSFAEAHPELADKMEISAEVRFGTDKDTETELFNKLNGSGRIPVAPNVILRNLREKHPGVLTLYGLTTNEKNFALYRRVCWNQRMIHGDIITATVLARVSHALHTVSQGSTSRPEQLSGFLDNDVKNYKMSVFRQNVVEFFEVVDACYGVRSIEINEKITHMRANFLVSLAGVFHRYADFWKVNNLKIDTATKRRLATFPINDPTISRTVSSGTTAVPLIQKYIVKHLNKGKRNKLTKKVEVDDEDE
jgi:hypothetical protein